ncbi:MAG: thioesterase [Verrucomicrobiota bacterium]|nr:thioesterase [Verrucomicrobiota bacterium]MDD8052030.1 thioesterase [Verrucomicrobiota bacterium]
MERRKAYRHKFRVRSYEVGPEELIRPWCLLQWLQETAVNASAARGFDMLRYRALGTAWVLRQWRVQVDRLPAEGEEVTIGTWVSMFRGSRSHREFLLTDSAGATWGDAQAEWVYMDRIRRRPVRVNTDLLESFQESLGTILMPPETAVWLEGAEPAAETATAGVGDDRVVRYSDLDSWDHTNQAAYIRWVLDGSSGRFSGFRGCHVRYIRETRAGDRVRIRPLRWPGTRQARELWGAQVELLVTEEQWQPAVQVAVQWANTQP